MKKLIAILLLVLPLSMSAQHLKFMGIPLNGTITTFTTKLKAKGFKISPHNKDLVACRGFVGTFYNKEADVYVYYDDKSKGVYRAKAVIDNDDESRITSLMSELEVSLKKKYDTFSYPGTQDNHDSYRIPIFNDKADKLLGYIDLYISVYKAFEWSDPSYSLHIDYIDYLNEESAQQSKEADL